MPMADRQWGSGYDQRTGRPPIVPGRYDVEDDQVTYGQGDFGWEQRIHLDDGPCDDPECDGPHVDVR